MSGKFCFFTTFIGKFYFLLCVCLFSELCFSHSGVATGVTIQVDSSESYYNFRLGVKMPLTQHLIDKLGISSLNELNSVEFSEEDLFYLRDKMSRYIKENVNVKDQLGDDLAISLNPIDERVVDSSIKNIRYQFSLGEIDDLNPPMITLLFSSPIMPEQGAITPVFSHEFGPVILTVVKKNQLFLPAGQTVQSIAIQDGAKSLGRVHEFLKMIYSGILHIIPYGLDHILFVIALCFVACSWRELALMVSIFTLAHTVSFYLASVGLVTIPAYIVEPVIALSILLVALEALKLYSLGRAKLWVVFTFGLLHGLGFAGVFSELMGGINAQWLALIGFSLGVEIGQLIIVALVFAIVFPWQHKAWYEAFLIKPTSISIGVVGLYWFLSRLMI